MTYNIEVKKIHKQPIAAVRRRIKITEISSAWKPALDLVWSFLQRNPALRNRGHNVFVYHPLSEDSGSMDVDFGVQVVSEFEGEGEVFASSTPAGEVASAVADGYAEIGSAHEAIQQWCEERGRDPAGVSTEIYGDPDDKDPTKIDIEVMYLLR